MKFHSTPVTNLLRSDHGTYYARVKHGGRQHWKSLKTKVLTVARARLAVAEEEIRGRQIRPGAQMTFAQAAQAYRTEVEADPTLKAGTKEFRLLSERTIARVAPELPARDVRRITAAELLAVLRKLDGFVPPGAKKASGTSATTWNRVAAYLRHVLGVAIEQGLIAKNPAAGLPRKVAPKKLLALPNKAQFAAILAHIRSVPISGADSADLVAGLAYSGMRIEEAGMLRWDDVDFERGQVAVRGTKTHTSARIIPMTSALRTLLAGMARRGEDVFRRKECLRTLTNACATVKAPRLRHHDLRHYFATACIESGVDIPTVSRWLGHADGGALAMRTYSHLRASHSTEAAAKVNF